MKDLELQCWKQWRRRLLVSFLIFQLIKRLPGNAVSLIDINMPADLANRLTGILSDKNILDKKGLLSASALAEDIGRVDNYVGKLSDIYNTVGKVEA